MKLLNPDSQTTKQIVASLLKNTSRQYTETAHAEIFRRLTETISDFNKKAERSERFMLVLATAQVILAIAQIVLALS